MSYGTEVVLKTATPDAEALIEWAGRLCYATDDKTGQAEGWLQKRIAEGHESLIEHASATFLIKCSRVTTHQLVRHRIASYSQRSQRYVRETEPNFITPSGLSGIQGSIFSGAMRGGWAAYRELLQLGVKPDQARYVLPNACRTEIAVTMNFRELRHFIKLRTGAKASQEMQEVAGQVRDICVEQWPAVFGDYV